MDGILVLAHGSRVNEIENTLEAVVGRVREKLPKIIIEIAYMEFRKITIEKGLNRLLEKGVTNIKVIPYFLFEGIHIKESIPREIETYLKDKDKNRIRIKMGKTFGLDKRLSDILVDMILE